MWSEKTCFMLFFTCFGKKAPISRLSVDFGPFLGRPGAKTVAPGAPQAAPAAAPSRPRAVLESHFSSLKTTFSTISPRRPSGRPFPDFLSILVHFPPRRPPEPPRTRPGPPRTLPGPPRSCPGPAHMRSKPTLCRPEVLEARGLPNYGAPQAPWPEPTFANIG